MLAPSPEYFRSLRVCLHHQDLSGCKQGRLMSLIIRCAPVPQINARRVSSSHWMSSGSALSCGHAKSGYIRVCRFNGTSYCSISSAGRRSLSSCLRGLSNTQLSTPLMSTTSLRQMSEFACTAVFLRKIHRYVGVLK